MISPQLFGIPLFIILFERFFWHGWFLQHVWWNTTICILNIWHGLNKKDFEKFSKRKIFRPSSMENNWFCAIRGYKMRGNKHTHYKANRAIGLTDYLADSNDKMVRAINLHLNASGLEDHSFFFAFFLV